MKLKLAKLFHWLSVKLGYSVKIINTKLNVNIQTNFSKSGQLEEGFGVNLVEPLINNEWKRFCFSFYIRVADKNDNVELKMASLEQDFFDKDKKGV